MDLDTAADGTISDATEDDVRRVLADDRDPGELFTLSAADSEFIQAGEAQWVARTTDINGWEESYHSAVAGLTEETPPPRYVLWHREPDDHCMWVATQVLSRGEVREAFRQFLRGDRGWHSARSWSAIEE